MKQLVSSITLGVKDLDKMKRFYRESFGWTPLNDSGPIILFQLPSLILSLYPEDHLSAYVGEQHGGSGFKRITFVINCASEEEVDEAVTALRKKAVRVVKEPGRTFWGGYTGIVADPEDNFWEIAYDPYVLLDEEGRVAGYKI